MFEERKRKWKVSEHVYIRPYVNIPYKPKNTNIKAFGSSILMAFRKVI